MTPEQASAQICATLESVSGKCVTEDGEAEVFLWCQGSARSGKPRPELLATPEGETLLRVMLRRIRNEQDDVLGIFHMRGGKWDSRGIQALSLAIDSDTRLCNGDDIP
jgi:hypothetical protein